ncbi:MAG TPA: ATP-binding protein [Oligoflexus sp.]|uniref:sensor histidine kinase n=1 Tax=Oligoflexus sp. TaxID=1971216 RepID=UPI002D6ED791|nr:ATP-binding protein [Oligoflexus sp.]HYX38918.1 ATP-binding protein [Oligoflexus sp.]
MLSRIPIRIRLSAGHAVWMALIFVAIGIGVSKVVEDSVMQSLDATLMTSAKTLRDSQHVQQQKLSAYQDPHDWEAIIDEFFGSRRYVRAYGQLIDPSGKVRARASNIRVNLAVSTAALERAKMGQETYETYRIASGGSLRQLTLPVMRQGQFTDDLIQVAATMSGSLTTIHNVRTMLWITLGLGFVVSLVFGYLLTSWSLKPVTRITREVAALGFTDNFDRRLKLPSAEDELRLLVRTFNEMLGRIEDAFGRLRRFAGDVSHELRTPIAVLRGEAELALRRERSPEEYKSSMRTIVHEAEQMSGIVENLLLLARAQGEAIQINLEEAGLERFVEELKHSVEKNFSEKQVTLAVDTTECQGKTAKMASGYVTLALKNILLNACKHSSPGQTVELKVLDRVTEWRFEIKDYGEGIAKEALPYIFDLFYRADTARNRSSGGVGIGLSLAKALVSLHNGRIEVTSEAKQGATFSVILPREIDATQKATHRPMVQRIRSCRPFDWFRRRVFTS